MEEPSTPTNQSPIANFTYTIEGLKVTFKDTSVDPDGNITAWNWSFGDGNYSNEQNPTHTYKKAGTYTVNLTVWDNDGLSNKTSKTITVIELIKIETGAKEVKIAWKSFFGKAPRYSFDVDLLSVGKIGLPTKLTYDYWLWKTEKPVSSIAVYGINKSKQTGWLIKHYDWVRLVVERGEEITIDNQTYYMWEIKDYEEVKKNYDVIVIIPNPGIFDSEWWLELTKSGKV